MFIQFNWICGLSFGIEYTNLNDSDYLVLDIGVFRIVFEKFNTD